VFSDAPIEFEYKGKSYKGSFHLISGTGHRYVWQLYLNNFFYGSLRYSDRWVFEGSEMRDMAEYFGEYIVAWYDGLTSA